MCEWWLAIVAAAQVASAGAFVTDGNVVGIGAEWTEDYRVLYDGDDARVASPGSPGGYEFHDEEDIDEVLLWVDLVADSLRVAWKTLAPPFPNRSLTDFSGTHDRGTLGLLLDVDADSSTGMLTSRTGSGWPTYAAEVIGADLALALTFDRAGDDPLTWTPTRWPLSGGTSPSEAVAGKAAFGVTHDGSGLGPNALWTEGAWSLSHLRALWEPIIGGPVMRRGDLIGVAGLMSTPILFGLDGEEITNGGFFLVGWGPVTRSGDGLRTTALHDAQGGEIIRAGLPIRYDGSANRFVVDGEAVTPYLGGDVPTAVRRSHTVLTGQSARLIRLAPNPFNAITRIAFFLPERADVALAVHDLTGRRVRTLCERPRGAGVHAVTWDGRDDRGNAEASGVYFVRLRVGEAVRTERVTLVR